MSQWPDLDFLRDVSEFTLPTQFGLAAYFLSAITGALAALRRGYDIIGVLVLATITAGGGGLIRDGLLISRGPPGMLTDPSYLIAVVAGTLSTLLFHRFVVRLARTIAVFDALSLGAFAVHGVQVCLDADLSVPGAVLGGTLTCVGGGILRDVLVRDEPLVFKPGQFYALVAVGSCVLYLALMRWGELTDLQSALITIVATFAFRMLTIRFNWRTTALYREPPAPPVSSKP
jgi:uncharacterized membrane protein YeiH